MNEKMEQSPPLSWSRRAGRQMLRYLRPLAAPLLHRMQLRIQSAIEYSSLADSIRRTETDANVLRMQVHDLLNAMQGDLHAEKLSLLDAMLDEQQVSLSIFKTQLSDILIHLPRLQLGVDALRREQKQTDEFVRLTRLTTEETLRVSQNQLTDLQAQVTDLQAGLLATAANEEMISNSLVEFRAQVTDLQAGLLATAGNEEIISNSLVEFRDQVTTLHGQLDASIEHDKEALNLAKRVCNVQDEGLALLGLLMSRADILLQRATIPVGSNLLMRTPEGFLLVPMEDATLVAAVWESSGRLEYGTVKVITSLLSEGDHVIDVGANIGLTVLPAARQVGPTGRVTAIEPGSRASEVLAKSIALNFLLERVQLHKCAAGEAVGKAYLNVGEMVGHSSLLPLPGASRTEEVDVRPLDDIVEPGQRVRLVKIDAEGFESQVWRGMRRIFAENPDLALVVEFGPEHLRRAGLSIEDWLGEFLLPGFEAYEISEDSGRLRPLRAIAELESVFSLNLLLTRQLPATLGLDLA